MTYKTKKILGLAFLLILVVADIGLGLYILRLRRQLQLAVPEVFVVEEYRPANIVVNAKASLGKIQPFWQGFAQGGEEVGGSMLASTVSEMSRLSPRYIRLDHIFDDDYYGVVKGDGGFDFSRLDAEVDRILAMGAKPFFALGYMSGHLASSKISVPNNWSHWQALVKATVEHYSGRGGKNIADVYYEVWNEPDLEIFGGWSRGGAKNYLTLYSYSAQGAMAAANVNRFYLGGPATTGLYRNWVLDLINFCSKNNLRLDFISWHRYSFSPNQFLKDIKDTFTWLGDSRDNYDWIITEWGPTPEKSGTYGSRYAAAHAFATVRRLLGLADLLFAFEVKDGPGQGSFGWGVLAHQSAGGYRKPRFHAFSWLNQLVAGERLALRGEGTRVSAVATKSDNLLSVFLVNFDVGGGATEQVPVKIIGLPGGAYQVNKSFLFSSGQNEQTTAASSADELATEVSIPANEIARIDFELVEKFEGEGEQSTGFGKLLFEKRMEKYGF